MSQPTPEFQIKFLTDMQRLLSEGLFVATYKYALLMALADTCVERGKDDDAPLEVPTLFIAEKFIQYYWRQSMPFLPQEQVLRQNTGRLASSGLSWKPGADTAAPSPTPPGTGRTGKPWSSRSMRSLG